MSAYNFLVGRPEF